MMKYLLTAYSETYAAESVRLPSESILSHQPAGHPYSFVSPIRLPIGRTFVLTGPEGDYELLVNGCFGFAYSGKFFISGTIVGHQDAANRETAAASPKWAA
jgi:hypothetical protein